MFGRGGVFVHSSTVYTDSFARATADLNSCGLAWATVNNAFPPWPPWRFARCASGPLWGIRFWPVAVAATLGWCVSYSRLRRIVPAHQCARCRYDLRGLSPRADNKTICPECGSISEP